MLIRNTMVSHLIHVVFALLLLHTRAIPSCNNDFNFRACTSSPTSCTPVSDTSLFTTCTTSQNTICDQIQKGLEVVQLQSHIQTPTQANQRRSVNIVLNIAFFHENAVNDPLGKKKKLQLFLRVKVDEFRVRSFPFFDGWVTKRNEKFELTPTLFDYADGIECPTTAGILAANMNVVDKQLVFGTVALTLDFEYESLMQDNEVPYFQFRLIGAYDGIEGDDDLLLRVPMGKASSEPTINEIPEVYPFQLNPSEILITEVTPPLYVATDLPTASPTTQPTNSPTKTPVTETITPTLSPNPSPTLSPNPSPTLSPNPSPTLSPNPPPTPAPSTLGDSIYPTISNFTSSTDSTSNDILTPIMAFFGAACAVICGAGMYIRRKPSKKLPERDHATFDTKDGDDLGEKIEAKAFGKTFLKLPEPTLSKKKTVGSLFSDSRNVDSVRSGATSYSSASSGRSSMFSVPRFSAFFTPNWRTQQTKQMELQLDDIQDML